MSTLERPTRQLLNQVSSRGPAQAPPFPVRRFLVDEYLRLVEAGFFGTARVELWEGWVVERMTHGALASAVIMILDDLIRDRLPDGYALRVQLPLVCESSCPEPDLAVVVGRGADYRSRHPQAADSPLVIEVSDSTLAEDRRHKLALYAGARIPQYWIVNCGQRQVEVYQIPTGPDDQPGYHSCRTLQNVESIPLQFGDQYAGEIAVSELFP